MIRLQDGKQVVIEFAGMTSIDGQSKPGGKFHILEIEDGEWIGGCYATAENLHEKIEEFLIDPVD